MGATSDMRYQEAITRIKAKGREPCDAEYCRDPDACTKDHVHHANCRCSDCCADDYDE